jgi:NDP-sugar pyrophosphorylase family protein
MSEFTDKVKKENARTLADLKKGLVSAYSQLGEERKYELTDDVIEVDGHTLKRIRAVEDFSDVKVGDLGGYIENENELSQLGNCWVYGDAKVYGYGDVCGNARIMENATVCDNAVVFGDTRVSGNAVVKGHAKVYGNAVVCDNTIVYDYAIVRDNAKVKGHAEINKNAEVYGSAVVSGNTKVHGGQVY